VTACCRRVLLPHVIRPLIARARDVHQRLRVLFAARQLQLQHGVCLGDLLLEQHDVPLLQVGPRLARLELLQPLQ
jgi:hypothetical protein